MNGGVGGNLRNRTDRKHPTSLLDVKMDNFWKDVEIVKIVSILEEIVVILGEKIVFFEKRSAFWKWVNILKMG